MNCPKCRRKLDYIAELSTPNAKNIKEKALTYYCSSCLTLYRIGQFDTKMKVRGVLVMKGSNLKRAGFYEKQVLARSPSRRDPKKR